jgi:hypothetical protein
MWKVPPHLMCQHHVLGEHAELHLFISMINRNSPQHVASYVDNGLLEPRLLADRHAALAAEITKRFQALYAHQTPLYTTGLYLKALPKGYVCPIVSARELERRCADCRLLLAPARSEILALTQPPNPPHKCDSACIDRAFDDEEARPTGEDGYAIKRQAR